MGKAIRRLLFMPRAHARRPRGAAPAERTPRGRSGGIFSAARSLPAENETAQGAILPKAEYGAAPRLPKGFRPHGKLEAVLWVKKMGLNPFILSVFIIALNVSVSKSPSMQKTS